MTLNKNADIISADGFCGGIFVTYKGLDKVFRKKSNAVAFILICVICISLLCVFSVKKAEKRAAEKEAIMVQIKAEEEARERAARYHFPPAQEENDLLKIATSAQGLDGKVCYLTFDDGPTKEVTPKVLDVLAQYDVKATFFVLGRMLESNPDIAKRAFDEGHLIANHSYYHQYDELYASVDSFIGEIEKNNNLIFEITGEEPFKLFRFPGGGHNAGKYGETKQQYKEVLKEKGYYFADWNCLNGDAEVVLRSTDGLLARIKETAIGKNIVVLMHDAAIKTTTPDALGSIIEYLRGQGYEFKRLDQIEYYAKPEPEEHSMVL